MARRWITVCVCSCLAALAGHRISFPTRTTPQISKESAIRQFKATPLAFEANVGQTAAAVSFVARGQGYTMWATTEGPVLRLVRAGASNTNAVVKLRVVGGEPDGHPSAEALLPGRANYFLGNEPSLWKTNVARYAALRYSEVYPGVDLVLHGTQESLEYDFDVAPNTDASRIAVRFDGATNVRIEPTGDLTLTVADGEIGFRAPVAYQQRDGAKEIVAARYELDADQTIRFELGEYDRSRPLTIDPVLSYSTYLGGTVGQFGGNGNDKAFAVAVDVFGNAYLAGETASIDFPTPGAPWDTTCGACTNSSQPDAFVAKIDPNQSGAPSLIFATYLGSPGPGSGTGSTTAYGVAADSTGNVYVTGETGAFFNGTLPNKAFPTTANAFQQNDGGDQAGADAFLTKLNASGSSLLYSTYIGGNNGDAGTAIKVDDQGHAYLAGWAASSNFPATLNGFKTTNPVIGFDGFVAKFDTTLSGAASLQYGSYLGGHSQDRIGALAIDAAGRMYVTGMTQSSTFLPPSIPFPVLNGFQMTTLGGQDSFMTMIDPTKVGAASLVYSTLISSNGTENGAIRDGGIAVDQFGMVYVAGTTFGASPANNFPTTPGAIKTVVESSDAYVIKIDPSQVGAASLVASTLVGAGFQDNAAGIAVDQNNNPVLIGSSISLPMTCGPPVSGNVDGFVMVLDPALTSVKASTRIGGTGTDFVYGLGIGPLNQIYVTGYTESLDFPTSNDSANSKAAFDTTGNGQDAFLSVITSLLDNNCAAPAAVNQSASTAEDTVKLLALAATDADGNKPTPDTLTWKVVTGPTHGDLDISAGTMTHGAGPNYTAAVTYTPAANYSGPDSFTFRVSDGWFTSNTATVTLTITAVNDPPSPGADTASTTEDVPVTVTVLTNDTDPEGNTLNVTQASCSNATATVNPNKTVTVSPAPNFNGTVVCTYTLSDGTSTAIGDLTVTVTPVNDGPSASTDSVSTPEDTPVTAAVLGNDTDPDGDGLTVTQVTCGNGAAGAVVNADNTVTVTPNANYSGPIACAYTASDGNGGTATGQLNVTVTSVNDAPSAAADAATTNEDVPVTVNVLGNDTDLDGDSLSVTQVSCSDGAGAAVNPDKTITVSPAADFNGSITCSYTADDGHGGTATGQLTVSVTAVNDNPSAGADAATTPEDMPVTLPVLANDSDVDGNALTVTAPTCNNGAGVMVNGDNSITVTPAPNFTGTIVCGYTVVDGQGGSATAQAIVTVTPVNDAPSAGADTASTQEDVPVTVNVLGNDSDLDGDSLFVTAPLCSNGAGAAVNPDGTITVTPVPDFNGTITCSFTVNDGQGGTAPGQLVVTVNPVNDNPVAAPDTASTDDNTLVNVPVLANDGDADGDAVTLESVGACQQGELTQNADGTVTYKPKSGFNGVDVCSYTVSDGQGGTASGSLSVTVTAVNDPPSLSPPADQQTQEGSSVSLQVTATDPDNDTLAFSAAGLPNGLTIDPATGLISGAPAAGTVGSHQVTVTVADGNGGSTSVSFTWLVTSPIGVNQVPVCTAAQPSIGSIWPPNHQLVSIAILGVTDPDGGQPAIIITRILQDEPTNTFGDGTTWIDGFGVGSSTASVRAERTGTNKVPGDGRVYQIFFTATDALGATCDGSVFVGVPHDQGNGPAVDSLIRYDSTVAGGQPINQP